MTQFINDRLDAEDIQAFLDHIDSCPECREELEVNYSLMTAMKQLDEDTDLSDNYIEELNQKIETCYLEELKRKRSGTRRRILLAIVVILLVLQSGIVRKDARNEEDRRFLRRMMGEEVVEDSGHETGTELQEYSEAGFGEEDKE